MIASRLTTPSAACVCSMVGKAEREREKCETKEVKKEGERREEVTKEGKRRKRRAAISRRKDRTTDRPTDRPTDQFSWLDLTHSVASLATNSIGSRDKVRQSPSSPIREQTTLNLFPVEDPLFSQTKSYEDTVPIRYCDTVDIYDFPSVARQFFVTMSDSH